MIGQPSIAQLLRSVSHDLRKIVEPAVSDASVGVMVQMMADLLDSLARRDEGQHRWIVEESAAVEAVAARALATNAATEELRKAHEALQEASLIDDPAAYYEKASELLSCTTEAAWRARSAPLQAEVKTLLEQRLRNEVSIIGENFQVIGRS